jgi:hypothetical protein
LAVRGNRNEMIPHLIEAIRRASQRAREGQELDNAHFFALMMLWEFQAQEAFPAILESITLPADLVDGMYGDAITDCCGRVLAALGADQIDRVDVLIDDPKVNEYVRWEAIEYLSLLVRDGRLTRDEVVDRYRRHLTLAVQSREKSIISFLIHALSRFYPREAQAEIDRAFDLELVDTMLIRRSDVRRAIADGVEGSLKNLAHLYGTSMPDAIEYLRGWYCFSESARAQAKARANAGQSQDAIWRPIDAGEYLDEDEVDEAPFHEPLERAERVGRNASCPCGSGKKYKKCCLRK